MRYCRAPQRPLRLGGNTTQWRKFCSSFRNPRKDLRKAFGFSFKGPKKHKHEAVVKIHVRQETFQHQAAQAGPGTTTAGIVDTETLQSLAIAHIGIKIACVKKTVRANVLKLNFIYLCMSNIFCFVFVPKPLANQDSCAVVCEFADSVQNQVHNLLPDGVVSACKIICRVFLSADQLLRVEELAIGARAYLVHHRRFLSGREALYAPLSSKPLRSCRSMQFVLHLLLSSTKPRFKKKKTNTTHGRKYVGNHHAVTNLLFFMRVHIVIIKTRDRPR